MYWEREVRAGNTIEVKRYHTGRARPRGEPRQKRCSETSFSQEEVNRKNAEDMLRWLLNTNFGYGDYHIVLNYQREPCDPYRTFDEMRCDVSRFIRNLKRRYLNEGKEMKYVYVIEVGEKSSRHTHIVLNGISIKLIQDCWQYGRITCTPLDRSGDYRRLANYLMKYSDKTFRNVGAAMKTRYSRSRNLQLPKIKKTLVKKASTYRKEPVAKKGYEIITDTVEHGVDMFGYPFMKYSMVRLE